MFRRSGYRFADKNMRQSRISRACSDSEGTEHALGRKRSSVIKKLKRDDDSKKSHPELSGVQQLEQVLVDRHVLAERDRRRLAAAHQVHPAPRLAGGVELLDDRLMVLEGMHLGEVVVADELRKASDQRLRIVAAVHVLLREIHRAS